MPVKDKEAKTVARAMFDGFALPYGGMREIRTDLGTEYNNQTITELFELLPAIITKVLARLKGIIRR